MEVLFGSRRMQSMSELAQVCLEPHHHICDRFIIHELTFHPLKFDETKRCPDMMRQYEALKSLDHIKDNLKSAVFCKPSKSCNSQDDKKAMNSPSHPLINKPPSVISQVWDKIIQQTNPFQLSAIEKVASGKAKNNITLLQGPPGESRCLPHGFI